MLKTRSYRAMVFLVSMFLAGTASTQIAPEQEDAGIELLARNGVEIEGQYHITRYLAYKNGGGMISVLQIHDGLIVFDSELAFHFVEGGELVRALDGSAKLMGEKQDLDGVRVDADQLIDEQQAVDVFAANTKKVTVPNIRGAGPGSVVAGPECTQDPESIEATLGIYERKVVWRVKCRERRNPLMYIDAVTGTKLFLDSGIRS